MENNTKCHYYLQIAEIAGHMSNLGSLRKYKWFTHYFPILLLLPLLKFWHFKEDEDLKVANF